MSVQAYGTRALSATIHRDYFRGLKCGSFGTDDKKISNRSTKVENKELHDLLEKNDIQSHKVLVNQLDATKPAIVLRLRQ